MTAPATSDRIYQKEEFDAGGADHSLAMATGTLWEHDKPTASCNHGVVRHPMLYLTRVH